MVRSVIGGVLCLVGIVWIGQGVGAIHGSFMTGQSEWTVFGVITLVIGLALLSLARRARRNAEDGA
jgi:hypothetical protein